MMMMMSMMSMIHFKLQEALGSTIGLVGASFNNNICSKD